MLNMTILAALTYHVKVSKGNQFAVGYTSVTIAFVTFIGILAYHIFQQLRHTKLCKKFHKLNLGFKKLNTKQTVNNLNHLINDPTETVNFNQFCDPWIQELRQPTQFSLILYLSSSGLCLYANVTLLSV